MRALIMAFLGISLSSTWALAQTSTAVSVAPEAKSSTGISEVLRDKKYEEDKRITDLELRAYQGSMSRYSLQFRLGYSGPPVNNLSDPHKPNPDNRPGDQRTVLSGSASLRYRINSNTGVNFGTGIAFYEPYQAVTGKEQDRPQNKNNYGVNDPRVSLDRTYKAFDTQMRTSLSASATTNEDYLKRGQAAAFGLTQYFKFTPGSSRIVLGTQIGLDYFAFSREYKAPVNGKGGDGNVSKYYLMFIPSFEYKITDTLNFNTSLGIPYSNLRADNSWWRWNHPMSNWRVGIGWAITRDIYVNPYVNFYADSPAFNTASANIDTSFAIF